MSPRSRVIRQEVEGLPNLEQQMQELRALRRALCLRMAERNYPRGARRRMRRAVVTKSQRRRTSTPLPGRPPGPSSLGGERHWKWER